MSNEILHWLQGWYKSNCNEDWEHSFGVTIETIDNPGWSIRIDLEETNMETYKFDSGLIENNKDDWYQFKFVDSTYEAFGDSSKLEFLLEKFKETVIRLEPTRK